MRVFSEACHSLRAHILHCAYSSLCTISNLSKSEEYFLIPPVLIRIPDLSSKITMDPNSLAVPNFDGTSDTRSQGRSQHSGGGSRPGSNTGGSQSGRSRSGSASQKTSAFPPGLGFDPALDDPSKSMNFNKNLDLPPEAYAKVGHLERHRPLCSIYF